MPSTGAADPNFHDERLFAACRAGGAKARTRWQPHGSRCGKEAYVEVPHSAAKADVGGSCNDPIVDFLDASDYDFLLPRRVRKLLAVGLMVGIAFVPPVQRWWLEQIDTHAQHLTREFVGRLGSDGSGH
jgi:hypothetical protein